MLGAQVLAMSVDIEDLFVQFLIVVLLFLFLWLRILKCHLQLCYLISYFLHLNHGVIQILNTQLLVLGEIIAVEDVLEELLGEVMRLHLGDVEPVHDCPRLDIKLLVNLEQLLQLLQLMILCHLLLTTHE